MAKQTIKVGICTHCVHKDICKYTEALQTLEADLKLEEPFEVNCKKKTTSLWPTTPLTSPAPNINWRDFTTPTVNAICKTCGYFINGKCDAPNNIVGLPCQTVTCTTASADELPVKESKAVSSENIVYSYPNSACASH